MKLYEQCSLKHIPTKLHRRGRSVCNRFYINEEIYRRCPSHLIDIPFASITLSDISVNRQGKPNKKPICFPDDVLYNTKDISGPNFPKYPESIVVLKIKKLLKNKSFRKILTHNSNILTLQLKHDPLVCNYSHTVFELTLNETVITFDNYDSLLKKKAYKILRDNCRLEIAKMIIRREIK